MNSTIPRLTVLDCKPMRTRCYFYDGYVYVWKEALILICGDVRMKCSGRAIVVKDRLVMLSQHCHCPYPACVNELRFKINLFNRCFEETDSPYNIYNDEKIKDPVGAEFCNAYDRIKCSLMNIYKMKNMYDDDELINSKSIDQCITAPYEDPCNIKGNKFFNDKADVLTDLEGKRYYIHNLYVYNEKLAFLDSFLVGCKGQNCPAWGIFSRNLLYLSMGHTHEPLQYDASRTMVNSIFKNCSLNERLSFLNIYVREINKNKNVRDCMPSFNYATIVEQMEEYRKTSLHTSYTFQVFTCKLDVEQRSLFKKRQGIKTSSNVQIVASCSSDSKKKSSVQTVPLKRKRVADSHFKCDKRIKTSPTSTFQNSTSAVQDNGIPVIVLKKYFDQKIKIFPTSPPRSSTAPSRYIAKAVEHSPISEVEKSFSEKAEIFIDPGGERYYIHNSYVYMDMVTFMGRFMIGCKELTCPAWGVLVKNALYLSMNHQHQPIKSDADTTKIHSILKNCSSAERKSFLELYIRELKKNKHLKVECNFSEVQEMMKEYRDVKPIFTPYTFKVNAFKSTLEGRSEDIIQLLLNHLKKIRRGFCSRVLVAQLEQLNINVHLPQNFDNTNFIKLYKSLPKLISTETQSATKLSVERKQTLASKISEIKKNALQKYILSQKDDTVTKTEKTDLLKFICERLRKGDVNEYFKCIEIGNERPLNTVIKEETEKEECIEIIDKEEERVEKFEMFEDPIIIKQEEDVNPHLDFDKVFIKTKKEEDGDKLFLMHVKKESEDIDYDYDTIVKVEKI